MVLSGAAGMGWDPDALMNELESMMPGEYGIAPSPRGPAGTATTTLGSLLGISSQSKHPEAAWKVVRAEVLYRMGVRDLSDVPDRQHPWMYFADLEGSSIYPELVELSEKWVAPYGRPMVDFPGRGQAWPLVRDAVLGVFRGEHGVAEVVEATERANAILEQEKR